MIYFNFSSYFVNVVVVEYNKLALFDNSSAAIMVCVHTLKEKYVNATNKKKNKKSYQIKPNFSRGWYNNNCYKKSLLSMIIKKSILM